MSHMDSLKMRFTVGDFTTKWQKLEKGIMAGCTLSVALFVAAMKLLLKARRMPCQGPKADDGTRHPACKASRTANNPPSILHQVSDWKL